MRNDPWRTYAIAEHLASLGLAVFTLGGFGMPHANCDACKSTATDHMTVCTCLLCHGFHRATTDMDVLAEMLRIKPYSILGIRTGAPSRLVALDFDVHEGGADGLATHSAWTREELLPATWNVRTGGGGVHLYYGRTGTELATKPGFAPAVDLKSAGGYIVAPGFAKVGKQPYVAQPGFGIGSMAELPSWIVERVAKPLRRRLDARPVTKAGAVTACDHALDRLKASGAGSRNAALYALSCRAGEAEVAGMPSEDLDALRAQALGAALTVYSGMEWTERNFDSVWDSGCARGQQDANTVAVNPFAPLKRKVS